MGNPLHEPKEVTLLFGEITSYTLASERLVPAQLVAWVGETVAVVRAVADKHGGRIAKFLGDSVLVVFDSPSGARESAALECAHEIRREIRGLNQQLSADGWPPITFSMGIHTGEVVSAEFETGGPDRSALLGSAVALVARIESMTQELGSDLLISGAAFSRMDPAAASQCTPRGSVALRSGDGEVSVYELEMTGAVIRHERPPVPAFAESDGPTRVAQIMAASLDPSSVVTPAPEPPPTQAEATTPAEAPPPAAAESPPEPEGEALVEVRTGLFIRKMTPSQAEEFRRRQNNKKAA